MNGIVALHPIQLCVCLILTVLVDIHDVFLGWRCDRLFPILSLLTSMKYFISLSSSAVLETK